MKLILKNGTPFVLIILLISLSVYYSINLTTLAAPVYPIFQYVLLGLLVMLLGFGYGFNRLKVFYLGIHVLIMFLIQQGMLEPATSFTELVLPFLLAVNIATILMIKDGAVLSIQGKAIAFFLLIEVIIVYIFFKKIVSLLSGLNLPGQLHFEHIPDESSLFFILIFAFFIVNIIRSFTTYKLFLFGSILSILLSLPLEKDNLGGVLFLLTSSTLLLLAVVFRTYAMAYIDELTQIPSRRMLKVDMMKLGSKYTIAMLDIDFFKKFNDKYGHDVGDDVLILVAKGLKSVTGGGKAYRYGGEEFTIVFPRKNVEDVLPHLEELREKISKKEYLYRKKNRSGENSTQKLKVTISIGVAEKNGKSKSPTEVMKEADKALYRAKKKGRNCVSK